MPDNDPTRSHPEPDGTRTNRTHVTPPDEQARLAGDFGGIAVPGFEVEAPLGSGSFGVVYKARQVGLNRTVALKMLLGGPYASPAARARFLLEAEAVAALEHPHIVRVFAVGEHAAHPYIAMELVPGGTLADRVKAGGPLPPGDAAQVVVKLAGAVAHAHSRGVVHRDIKPGNVLLDAAGEPRLTDFGLAKVGRSDLTVTGQVLGTPAYMAPEQAAGKVHEVGTAADVYALGAVLYDLLTGRPPFLGDSAAVTLQKVLTEEPQRPRRLNAAIARDLETVCLKCLEKEPGKRYPTAQALADDLRRWRAGEPITARPAGRPERAWKWVGRNRLASGAMLAVVTALSVGTAVAVWQASRARDEADRAGRAEREAEDKAAAEADARRAAAASAAAERAAADRSRRLLANRLVALADTAWAQNNCRLAREALDQVPTGERRWEWHHLRWRFEGDGFALPVSGPQNAVAVTPNGEKIVVGGQDGQVRLFDARTGTPTGQWLGHAGGTICLAVTPDGRHLVTGGGDKAARVWDLASRANVRDLVPHDGPINAVAVDAGSGRVAVGSADGVVRVYRGPAGPVEREFVDRAGGLTTLAFTPSGHLIVGARAIRLGPDAAASLVTRDIGSGAIVASDGRYAQGGYQAVAASPSGRVATVSGGSLGERQSPRITDADWNPEERGIGLYADGPLWCVAAHPDGLGWAVGGDDGRVSAAGVFGARTFTGHTGPVRAVAFARTASRSSARPTTGRACGLSARGASPR